MAQAGDVQAVARKLRGKGLADTQVRENLREAGYSDTEAASAVSALSPTPPAATKAPRGGPRPGPPTPPEKPASQATPGITMPAFTAPSMPSLTLTPPRKLSGGDLGGFVAGLFAYAIFLNYIRFGQDGVKSWLRAKFLNEPNTELRVAEQRGPRTGGRLAPEGDIIRAATAAATSANTAGSNLRRGVMPGDFNNDQEQ